MDLVDTNATRLLRFDPGGVENDSGPKFPAGSGFEPAKSRPVRAFSLISFSSSCVAASRFAFFALCCPVTAKREGCFKRFLEPVAFTDLTIGSGRFISPAGQEAWDAEALAFIVV